MSKVKIQVFLMLFGEHFLAFSKDWRYSFTDTASLPGRLGIFSNSAV